MTIALLFAVFGCEKPRERACRALVIQAKNAESARSASAADPRVAAYRAQSAARWVRSNAVDDSELKAHANALADALERLADARLRLADASDVLGASDTSDLLARSERVSEYLAASDRVLGVQLKSCPWEDPSSLIDDPRCTRYNQRQLCPTFDAQLTLAEHAARCATVAEEIRDIAVSASQASELATALRAQAEWLKTLPKRTAKETVDRARGLPKTIEDRGRADADVELARKALEGKCAR